MIPLISGGIVGWMAADLKREVSMSLANLPPSMGKRAWANIRKIKPEWLAHPQIRAYLLLIRKGESSLRQEAFRMMNGGELFAAPPWKHPNRIGAGGKTRAAGAFQFMPITWEGVARELGLKDFSPKNQELAALGNLAHLGAIPDIVAGNLPAAFAKTSIRAGWTSLPGGIEQRFTPELATTFFVGFGGRINGK